MLGSFLWQGRVTSLFFLVFMGPPPEKAEVFIDLHSQILQGSDSSAFCLLRSKTTQAQMFTQFGAFAPSLIHHVPSH